MISRKTLAALCCSLVVLAACKSDLSPENYAKIENGMSMDEVTRILGKPSDTSTMGLGSLTGTAATWTDGKTTISVQFVNDKVQLKQITSISGK